MVDASDLPRRRRHRPPGESQVGLCVVKPHLGQDVVDDAIREQPPEHEPCGEPVRSPPGPLGDGRPI
jgi:hypothetical protein